MFGREKKTYNISYTTESGFKETTEVDTKQLRDLIQQEKNDATFTKTPDGRMILVFRERISIRIRLLGILLKTQEVILRH